jgi:FKBP-type peptidyl-prolyl cis-trans isomerase (trigger factor)
LALEGYLTSIGKKAEDLRAEYASQAKEAITVDLTLSKIAEKENLKVEPKEIEAALNMSQASANKDEDPESRKRLLESILKRRQALDFLMALA